MASTKNIFATYRTFGTSHGFCEIWATCTSVCALMFAKGKEKNKTFLLANFGRKVALLSLFLFGRILDQSATITSFRPSMRRRWVLAVSLESPTSFLRLDSRSYSCKIKYLVFLISMEVLSRLWRGDTQDRRHHNEKKDLLMIFAKIYYGTI